jgi:hypothetical protein
VLRFASVADDVTFATLDELAEADYYRTKNGPFRGIDPMPKAWHATGYRHGYRDAIRHTSPLGVHVPLWARIVAALEDRT